MFDARLRPLVDPVIAPLAKIIARGGISANMLTLGALIPAAMAVYALSQEYYGVALLLIVANRILDGLDGMVARINGPTALGGYLDIVADFAFYVSIPAGFGLAAPENLLPAMLLIAAFTVTGISFLAFASVAANNGISESEFGDKGFLYTTGLMEGGETIAFFIVFCLFPAYFNMLAGIFAALCLITVLQRSLLAAKTFR